MLLLVSQVMPLDISILVENMMLTSVCVHDNSSEPFIIATPEYFDASPQHLVAVRALHLSRAGSQSDS